MSLEDVKKWMISKGYTEQFHSPGDDGYGIYTSTVLLEFLEHVEAERAKGVTVTVDIETVPVYIMGEGPLWPEHIHTRGADGTYLGGTDSPQLTDENS